MLIWAVMLVPLLAIAFLAICFTKRLVWWEYLVLFFGSLAIVFTAKQTSIHTQTRDTEFWNSYILSVTYYEPWDEYIHETCTRTVSCGKDCEETETYDCSYVEDHPKYWEAIDNLGVRYTVSKHLFDSLCGLWGNKTFKDMNRPYHSYDGDAYYTVADNQFSHTVSVCMEHNYENKIQGSKSVFNFREVSAKDVKQYGLFEYPKADLMVYYNPILGDTNKEASLRLQQYNALYGTSKKLHMLLLVFKNQPYNAAIFQEAYWKGGNKNEFIMCVGVTGGAIQWTKVISWSKSEELKVRAARMVKEIGTYDAVRIADYMGSDVPNNYVKRSFKEFSYITVEPTTTATVVAFIVVFIFVIGWCIFSVNNEFKIGER